MSAITSPPAKILLSSSTKISLNDRFTKLEKVKSETKPINSTVRVGKPTASAKNTRLALQMANRPSVQAALRIKKKSIRQRLGFERRAAKNNNGIIAQQQQTIGFDPSRLTFNRGNLAQRLGGRGGNKNNIRGRPRFRPNRRGANNNPNNNNDQRIKRVGARNNRASFGNGNRRAQSAGGRINKRNSFGNRSFSRNRRGGGAGGGRGGRNRNRNKQNQNGGQKLQQQNQPKTKENLDMDLDQYMSKSKSYLDHDLDAYMSQAHPN